MHIARTHYHTPHHEGNLAKGIQRMLGADDCYSRRWAGGDWVPDILSMHIARMRHDTPATKAIDYSAFRGCSNLTNVEFCEEIEEFVSCKVMRDWWNQGVHEKSLSTYCFLVQYSIPDCLGLVLVRSWWPIFMK
jgi:hypothetical protein